MVAGNKIYRPFPVIMSQNIKNQQWAFQNCTALQLNINVWNYLISIQPGFTAPDAITFAHQPDPDCARRNIVEHFSFEICTLVAYYHFLFHSITVDIQRIFAFFHNINLVILLHRNISSPEGLLAKGQIHVIDFSSHQYTSRYSNSIRFTDPYIGSFSSTSWAYP